MKTARAGVLIALLAGWPAMLYAVFDVAVSSWSESARMSPEGDRIAFGQGDGKVVLVAAADGRPLGSWPSEGANQVTGMVFSSDGKRLLVVSPNRTIRLLATDEPGRTIMKWSLPEFYPGAGLSPDGGHVLTVAHQGPLRWCDAESGAVLREWRDVERPDGYSTALVLENSGLACVASMKGEMTLVDAAAGRVITRLEGKIGGYTTDVFVLPGSGDVALRAGGAIIRWSRSELLAALATPSVGPIRGQPIVAGGQLGAAVSQALPADEWVFWRVKAEPEPFTWVEPSWLATREAGVRGPAVVDAVRKRVWWQTGGNGWRVWTLGELGMPDELAAGGYALAPVPLGEGVGLARDVNGYSLSFDWRELAPIAVTLAPGHEEPTRRVLLAEAWLPNGNRRGAWFAALDPKAANGWTVLWRDVRGVETGVRVDTGFSGGTPGMRIAPDGTLAIFASAPGSKMIGGTAMVLPALQIWEHDGSKRRVGDFNDHRSVGMHDLRWSQDSRWLATWVSNGGGGGQWRVFSAGDGKRFGKPQTVSGRVDVAVGNRGELVWADETGVIVICDAQGRRELVGGAPWARAARLAISADGELVAALTAQNEIVVISAKDGVEIWRKSLRARTDLGWQAPSGGLYFVESRTLLVVSTHEAVVRVLRF